jgi:hypothetical protein
MPNVPGKSSGSSRRRSRYEDPVKRIHGVRSELEAEKKRLGLSEREWLAYIRGKNLVFESKLSSTLKSAKKVR